MFVKLSLLAVFAFLQVNVALGQEQGSQSSPSQQQLIQGMTPTQMWNPYSWITPYYAAANEAWGKYIKDAQEASNQLYQQWDKTGAGNLFSAGVDLAQQYAQQAAQMAAQQAQQAAKQAEEAAKQGQQVASQVLA